VLRVLISLLAAARRRPGARPARWLVGPFLAAAAALVLSGCQSDRNVSRAYECSKDHEYQGPGAPSCGGRRAGSALGSGPENVPAAGKGTMTITGLDPAAAVT
jgi:hypothetical protein